MQPQHSLLTPQPKNHLGTHTAHNLTKLMVKNKKFSGTHMEVAHSTLMLGITIQCTLQFRLSLTQNTQDTKHGIRPMRHSTTTIQSTKYFTDHL